MWTPITTNPCCSYASAHARMYESVRSQLMQVYVQKSTRTTFPWRSAIESGCELSHPVAPSNDANSPSMGRSTVSWVGGGFTAAT